MSEYFFAAVMSVLALASIFASVVGFVLVFAGYGPGMALIGFLGLIGLVAVTEIR